MLVLLAGAFIGLGALMFTLVASDATLDFAASRLLGGLACATGLAVLVWLSGHASLNGGAIGETAVRIAMFKAELLPSQAFFRGVLCNVLVCMAVWMALAGRSVTDKVVAIVFPITAFVAAGFEHSIANMYFFPLAMLLGAPLTCGACVRNLVPVIAGNIVGGSVLVALAYYVIYIRAGEAEQLGPVNTT
jgi:formate/nitrite transporter